jgi:hypothetical protein
MNLITLKGERAQEKTMATATAPTKKNVILQTDDYELFQLLPHNRPVVQSHVVRLAGSMRERPHLRPARPILVNEKYQVIDGQHRLGASRLNQQTVFYMIVEGLTISDARLLNALQRTWSLLDYAYSYASSGVTAYVQFVKAYEARELPPSVVLENINNSHDHRNRDAFRIGQLEVVDQITLDRRLDQLEEVLARFPKASTPYIVSSAFRHVQKIEEYNHARMMKKLETTKPQPQRDRVSYIRELERIYNMDYVFGTPNYLRFF